MATDIKAVRKELSDLFDFYVKGFQKISDPDTKSKTRLSGDEDTPEEEVEYISKEQQKEIDKNLSIHHATTLNLLHNFAVKHGLNWTSTAKKPGIPPLVVKGGDHKTVVGAFDRFRKSLGIQSRGSSPVDKTVDDVKAEEELTDVFEDDDLKSKIEKDAGETTAAEKDAPIPKEYRAKKKKEPKEPEPVVEKDDRILVGKVKARTIVRSDPAQWGELGGYPKLEVSEEDLPESEFEDISSQGNRRVQNISGRSIGNVLTSAYFKRPEVIKERQDRIQSLQKHPDYVAHHAGVVESLKAERDEAAPLMERLPKSSVTETKTVTPSYTKRTVVPSTFVKTKWQEDLDKYNKSIENSRGAKIITTKDDTINWLAKNLHNYVEDAPPIGHPDRVKAAEDFMNQIPPAPPGQPPNARRQYIPSLGGTLEGGDYTETEAPAETTTETHEFTDMASPEAKYLSKKVMSDDDIDAEAHRQTIEHFRNHPDFQHYFEKKLPGIISVDTKPPTIHPPLVPPSGKAKASTSTDSSEIDIDKELENDEVYKGHVAAFEQAKAERKALSTDHPDYADKDRAYQQARMRVKNYRTGALKKAKKTSTATSSDVSVPEDSGTSVIAAPGEGRPHEVYHSYLSTINHYRQQGDYANASVYKQIALAHDAKYGITSTAVSGASVAQPCSTGSCLNIKSYANPVGFKSPLFKKVYGVDRNGLAVLDADEASGLCDECSAEEYKIKKSGDFQNVDDELDKRAKERHEAEFGYKIPDVAISLSGPQKVSTRISRLDPEESSRPAKTPISTALEPYFAERAEIMGGPTVNPSARPTYSLTRQKRTGGALRGHFQSGVGGTPQPPAEDIVSDNDEQGPDNK